MSDKEFEEELVWTMTNSIRPEDRERAMKSSTFKALAEREEEPVSEWPVEVLDEVVGDTIAVDRVRWFERAVWLFVVIAVGVLAFMAGWFFKPIPEPEPIKWDCEVVIGSTEEVDCTGVQ